MLSLFASIWEWIKWAVAALMPFKRGRGLSPGMRWGIWIVLDVLVLALLYVINNHVVEIAPIVQRMPFQAPWLRYFFLPILGQLVIFLVIVLYWFYLLWFAEADDSPFPDIDDAWHEALHILGQSGVQLPRVPLFLVVGRAQSAEELMFDASGMKLVVRQAPANPHAPVHVYASNEAVYVTCRGASVLAKLADILALEGVAESSAGPDGEAGEQLDQTLRPGQKEQAVVELLRASLGKEATPIHKRAMRRATFQKPLGADFLSDQKEVNRFKARLAHLCRLIVRDRQPFCGANGILLLVPLGGTDTVGEAQFTAQATQEDLNVVRQELKLDCPLVSLLVDMEQLPGFSEFMQRQPPKELGNRRGNGFPMSTRLSRNEVLEQVRISLSWVCTTYLQDSVYRIFKDEKTNDKDPTPLFPGNSRLVLLLDEMNERANSLAVIVQQAIAPANAPLFRYSGCYMAATGAKGSQGFVAGVFQKLVKEQSGVSWTEAALAEDAQSRTWANYYLILSVVLFVGCGVLLGLILLR